MSTDRELTASDMDRIVGGYVDGLRHRFEQRMDTLEEKVDKINGSVRDAHIKLGEHDGRMNQLHRRLEGLATSVHERVRDAYDRTLRAIQAQMSPTQQVKVERHTDDSITFVRRVDLAIAIRIATVAATAGAGVVLWILKMLGKI